MIDSLARSHRNRIGFSMYAPVHHGDDSPQYPLHCNTWNSNVHHKSGGHFIHYEHHPDLLLVWCPVWTGLIATL